jgi:hypothetical protein
MHGTMNVKIFYITLGSIWTVIQFRKKRSIFS